MKDIIIAVADSYQEKLIEALLPRFPVSSNTSQFTFEVVRNPGNDAGSYNDSHELLRPFINQYNYSIVIFDYEGCGAEHIKSREQIESEVESLLEKNGWMDRTAAIVIQPEVEAWLWQDNPHVERALGWENFLSLYQWARQEGKIAHGEAKPLRPKETLELALRLSRVAKSSATYAQIAATVSYRNCTDQAFLKLVKRITDWFGAPV